MNKDVANELDEKFTLKHFNLSSIIVTNLICILYYEVILEACGNLEGRYVKRLPGKSLVARGYSDDPPTDQPRMDSNTRQDPR